MFRTIVIAGCIVTALFLLSGINHPSIKRIDELKSGILKLWPDTGIKRPGSMHSIPIRIDSVFRKHAQLLTVCRHVGFYKCKTESEAVAVFRHLTNTTKDGFKETSWWLYLKSGVTFIRDKEMLLVFGKKCSDNLAEENKKEDLFFSQYFSTLTDTTFIRINCGYTGFTFK
jgi:hypothetical protein